MDHWESSIKDTIEIKLKDTKERDLKFFRIEELKRNISRIESFSSSCKECSDFKLNINEVVETIDTAIDLPGKQRRKYDRLIGEISKHMMQNHGFHNPYYFLSLYSFFGMIAGFLIGYLSSKVIQTDDWLIIIIGFLVGLIIGYFIGLKKDNLIRKNKKLM